MHLIEIPPHQRAAHYRNNRATCQGRAQDWRDRSDRPGRIRVLHVQGVVMGFNDRILDKYYAKDILPIYILLLCYFFFHLLCFGSLFLSQRHFLYCSNGERFFTGMTRDVTSRSLAANGMDVIVMPHSPRVRQ